jgi:hypothetical protein
MRHRASPHWCGSIQVFTRWWARKLSPSSRIDNGASEPDAWSSSPSLLCRQPDGVLAVHGRRVASARNSSGCVTRSAGSGSPRRRVSRTSSNGTAARRGWAPHRIRAASFSANTSDNRGDPGPNGATPSTTVTRRAEAPQSVLYRTNQTRRRTHRCWNEHLHGRLPRPGMAGVRLCRCQSWNLARRHHPPRGRAGTSKPVQTPRRYTNRSPRRGAMGSPPTPSHTT